MKIKAMIAIALIISAVLMAGKVSPGINNEQFREGKYIHIDNMVIEFNRTNADVYIEYRLSLFAQTYMFLFGSKHLEPKIKEIFLDFGDVEIQRIGRASASITIKDISRRSDEFYLHDSREFGVQPDVLTIVYPDGARRNVEHAKSTPNTFYI